jgi:hypothetical protein
MLTTLIDMCSVSILEMSKHWHKKPTVKASLQRVTKWKSAESLNSAAPLPKLISWAGYLKFYSLVSSSVKLHDTGAHLTVQLWRTNLLIDVRG